MQCGTESDGRGLPLTKKWHGSTQILMPYKVNTGAVLQRSRHDYILLCSLQTPSFDNINQV